MSKFIKLSSKTLAFLLIFIMAFSMLLPSPGQAAEGKVIEISTVKQLKDLSKKCAIDSFSKDLTVKLMNDIDLDGGAFTPIPIFYGTFDGQGYEIKGFTIISKGSEQGFFRSVESSAVIRRLSLSARVAPTGSACSVGILAGKNNGIITGCTVTGSVKGDTDVGAIAGINRGAGLITGCSSEAAVTGKLHTGALAGKNLGTVEASVNRGEVNTSSYSEVTSTGIADIPSIAETVSEAVAETVSESIVGDESKPKENEKSSGSDVSDTGGIAGKNEGNIRGCTNYGTVGYNHVGYNIGGIAGNHNGIISGCENYGEVFGRKDVGGIAGQFEPDISLTFGTSSGENLEKQLNTLSSILRNLTNSMTSSISESLDSAKEINAAVTVIEDTLKAHSDTAGDELDITLDDLYSSLQAINASAEKINTYIKDFTAVADTEISAINAEMNDISAAIANANVSQEISDITKELDKISQEIKNISNALGDIEKLTSDINSILQDSSLNELQKRDAIEKILTEYNDSVVDKTSISDSIAKISDSFVVINQRISTINTKLGSSAAELAQSMQVITSATSRLHEAFTKFSNGVTAEASVINANIDKIEDVLYKYLNSAGNRLSSTFGTVYEQLNIVNLSLADILSNTDESNAEVNSFLNSAINQLDVIGTTVSNMLDKPEYSTVDVSENIELEEKPGQISSCRNNGSICADSNVGGIAGIMAIEIGNDPEEDFRMSESLWVDTTALFRAIIMTSTNAGNVTAKNDCAGGIVGRSDVGAVYKADSEATVETTNGSKCGGIAGSSESGIIRCNSLSQLIGNDSIGGIVGYGTNISNCRSMVLINSDGECIGAVAGYATGEIVGNAFVDEGLHGVDGISYAGMAYPLPYESFIALPELPTMFSELSVDFIIDDVLVKSLPFTYGGSISSWDVPKLPLRDDSFGQWEPFKTENLIRSARVNAIYSPWVTTLSSKEEIPLLLAEGSFSASAQIEISEVKPSVPANKAYRYIASYSYSIADEVREPSEKYVLHLRCEKPSSVIITLVDNGAISQITPKRDGSYVVFEAPSSGELIIIQPLIRRIIAVSFIILAVLIVLCFYCYIHKHFPKKETPAMSTSPLQGMANDASPRAVKRERSTPKKSTKGAHLKKK